MVRRRSTLGSMRTPIELRQPTQATDTHGRKKPTYATVATVLGRINLPVRSEPRDYRLGDLPFNVQHRLVHIHYRSDVTKDWQLRINSVDWNIIGVDDPDGRNEYLVLHCRQVDN